MKQFENSKVCDVHDFRAEKAKHLVDYLATKHNPFVTFIECRKNETNDIVCLSVKAELVQVKTHDIRTQEPIAIYFDLQDNRMPAVYALRNDFPRNVPHLNLEYEGWPASLCLYNERYRDIKPFWTPQRFLERIREWLRETAKGTLHKSDQPLEPFLFGSSTHIIIPEALLENNNPIEQLAVVDCSVSEGDQSALRVILSKQLTKDFPNKLKMTAMKIQLAAQEHGVINHTPRTLNELHNLLKKTDYDLIANLRIEMKKWEITREIQDSAFAIIVLLPKKRSADTDPETTDIWIFASTLKIHEVLEDIGVYGSHVGSGNYNVPLITGLDETKCGEKVYIDLLNPTLELTAKRASSLNGYSEIIENKIVAVGVGALGSQLVLNCIRSGFGKWTIVDEDILLPHNLARHGLDGYFLGRSKVASLQEVVNQTITDKPITTAIQADFIQPGNTKERLNQSLSESNIILDMSASLAVARHSTHGIKADARRISIFLSPSGKDLVVLAEDQKRSIRLDYLEMRYYMELYRNNKLSNHLMTTEKVRYANSCRDVSSNIPQDFVALHAAIASRELKSVSASEAGCIKIFQIEDDNQVSIVNPHLDAFREVQVGEWKICICDHAIKLFFDYRKEKLPNETGGVIIGNFDTDNRIIYVVDVLGSPSDSEEYPSSFIRGHAGLLEEVKKIQDKTSGNLTYLGEWHSHPDHAKCYPSDDDRQVLTWINEYMAIEGLPTVMIIAGDKEELCFCVENKKLVLEFQNVRK